MKWMCVLALVGCATARPIMGPDGTPHVSVQCKRSVENCYEKAAQSCPRGYDIVDTSTTTTVIGDERSTVTGHGFGMLIKCRDRAADPRAAYSLSR